MLSFSSKPKPKPSGDGKKSPAPEKSPDASNNPDGGQGNNGNDSGDGSVPDVSGGPDLLSDPLGWLLANPVFALITILIVITAAMWGLRRLWTRMTLRQNMRGRPLAPLGFTVRRALTLMLKEDKYPVLMKPQKLAERMQGYTWTKHWRLLFLLTILWFPAMLFIGGTIPLYALGAIGFLWFMGIQHVRRVFMGRHRILMQMFEVAAGEMRYPRGAELNPWGYVQISKWIDLYTPDETSIMYPPKYRSEDPRNREAFEINFNGTVSDQYTWTYNWESSNNRVVCTPVPFITTRADYPFPDQHPWDVVPLGIAAGGEEALLKISTYPHTLVAGTTGSGKALYLISSIPVPISDKYPTGWTTIGELETGDTIFDENGKPCTVTGVSETFDNHDMYEVHFSDGTHLVASGDHLWFTETRGTEEPRWNSKHKKVAGRSLVSEEAQEKLKSFLDTLHPDSEITIAGLASIVEVEETSPWLLDIAKRLGPVGTRQVIADSTYAEQHIRQKQPVTVYPAREAWQALASYTPKVPAWHAHLEECVRLAATTSSTDTVTASQVGKVLGVSASQADRLLQSQFVERWVEKRGTKATAVFPAREAWGSLAGTSTPTWGNYRELFLGKSEQANPGEAITALEIAEAAGEPVAPTQVQEAIIKAGVQGKVEEREVVFTLRKTVRDKSPETLTYLAHEFISEMLQDGETACTATPAGAVRDTREILATIAADKNIRHYLPRNSALELPEVTLPVEPYLLGAWLGRADSTEGLGSGSQNHASEPGTSIPKHIPEAYLRSSVSQRRDLLMGLLDAGGGNLYSGRASFRSTDEALSRQILELVRSLGYSANMTVTSEEKGERGEDQCLHQVTWEAGQRYITGIVRVPAVPARCIMVDSRSRLFLAGESMVSTHNSVTQRTILLHFLQQPDVRVCLVDPKRVELAAYRGHPNVLRVATELDESVALIEQIEQEMQSRYIRMQEEGKNFFKDMEDPPPALLLMIDETFALLSPENIKSDEGKERDELHARATTLIGSIARLGRAAGVHMILATQRPDAKVIPGETKPLALDTPVLTATGWSTLGELQEGDVLFDEVGAPTTVVKTTEVWEDHECFELVFTDGSKVVADGEHLWVCVEEDGARYAISSEELHEELSGGIGDFWLPQVSGAGTEQAQLGRVQIISVNRVDSVPVRCVAVDGPSQLFLVGEGCVATHNSNLDARIAQGRMDTIPSQMTLDSDAATRLPPVRGRAMLRTGNDFTEFQAYFLDTEHLPKVLEMTAALATGKVDIDFFLQAGGGADGGSGGKRKIPLPRIPLPAGLVSRFKNWVEKRKQVVEENELRAGRTAETRAERAKRKRVKDSEEASEEIAHARHEPSVAEVAAQAAARGTTADAPALFDGVPGEHHSESPARFDEGFLDEDDDYLDEVDDFGEDLWSEIGLPEPVAPPPNVDPATGLPFPEPEQFAPAPEIALEEQDFPEPWEPEHFVPPLEPFPQQVIPEEPAQKAESVPVLVPGLLVAEVLQRARARGIPVSASELLLALRREAGVTANPDAHSAAMPEEIVQAPPAPVPPAPLPPPPAVPAPEDGAKGWVIPPPPPPPERGAPVSPAPPASIPLPDDDDAPWLPKDVPLPPAKGPSPFGTVPPPVPPPAEGSPPPPPPPGPQRPSRP